MRREDLAAAHAMHEALLAADGPMIFTTQGDYEAMWDGPRCGRDVSWAADAEGLLAGFAMCVRRWTEPGLARCYFMLRVHPEFRRRGIGTRLWERLRESGAAQGLRTFDGFAYATSGAGNAFAAHLGFSQPAILWKMRLELADHRAGRADHPAAIRVFEDDARDFALLADMWNATFFEHFGFAPSDEADTRSLARSPEFDRSLILFAEQDGATAGFCRNEIDAEPRTLSARLEHRPDALARRAADRAQRHGQQ